MYHKVVHKKSGRAAKRDVIVIFDMDKFDDFPFILTFRPDAGITNFHLHPRPSPFSACNDDLVQGVPEYEDNEDEGANVRPIVHFVSIDWQEEQCCSPTPTPPPKLTLKPRPRVVQQSQLLFKKMSVRDGPPPKPILMPGPNVGRPVKLQEQCSKLSAFSSITAKSHQQDIGRQTKGNSNNPTSNAP